MANEPDKVIDGRLRIVTFNYDRSLDYSLYNSIKNSYGLSDSDTVKIMDRIPIIHVYGKLGDLPFMGDNVVPYNYCNNHTLSSTDIKKLIKEIKIIYESDSETTELKKCRELISQSEIVAFLGFGYHPLNIERILNSNFNKDNKISIYGTTFKVGVNDRQNIVNMFSKKYKTKIFLGTSSQDVLDYLNNTRIFKSG